ncbi:MAG: RnfABCDGE type electron transport complex subunit A [Clostridia bacterium]|nr:RnfABCDGE type electron transport complex subunit A [Clostridia bacterium]MBQ2236616.1 RnfABCDGE type electron transport complex subunit A [Clostridia bacterium]MEE1184988.1 RnfABCDGE type electron transport complex subunit A [Acutalibacteraceae bacterium]
MNNTTTIVSILLAAILTDNMVLSKFLGICPFLGVSKKPGTAFSMSIAVTLVMVVSTAVTYPIYTYLLYPKFAYLQTIVFILVIAAIVQLIEIVLKRFIKPVYNALGIYLPLITTNCAVLGVTMLNITDGLSFVQSLFNALGAGLGFMLAMLLFAGVRSKVEAADVPEFLKGLPITLIAAAIVSLSFLGFAGIGG